ncbi:MAG: TonB-dependent receptor [Saprospiraceae bacterium]
MPESQRQILDTDQKALEINLDDSIYGSFAEIGAGQEVARYFFKVGAAAGTIAKSMSAYDKVVSDDIYGVEASGRYVCEPRLYKMLDHEFALMVRRLRASRPETSFFAFADTIAAMNFQKTIKGDGWLGMRFQLDPKTEPNDIVIHVRMLDTSTQQQQQAIGVLGVNLVYACYHYHDDPETLLISLLDNLHGRIAVDMVRVSGPAFENVDNRLLCLWLVKHGLTEVAMFGPDKRALHASEFLYRKNVMVVRGNYRPATLVHMDLIKAGFSQFKKEEEIDPDNAFLLTEITLDNLRVGGKPNEKDFLDRADLLCSLGQTVVISNCEKFHKLISYLADYKIRNVGVVFGVRKLMDLINSLYYQNMDERLLAAFGEIFTKRVRIYVYPSLQKGSTDLMTCDNMPVPNGVHYLKHLLENRQIVDMEDYDLEVLHIHSKKS